MESNMVINSAQECNKTVKFFFEENLPDFSLNKEWIKAPYWYIEMNKNNIKIQIEGDMGFHIYIYIYNTKYALWQYDRSVNDRIVSIKENILYQLKILKQFLNEIGD